MLKNNTNYGLLLSHSKFKVTAIQLNLNEKAIVSDFTYELGHENHFIDQSQATQSDLYLTLLLSELRETVLLLLVLCSMLM